MSDQENRKLQHTDDQKPGSEQKSGKQPNQPVQQKQENPSGQPKSPQSEQEKHDHREEKAGLGVRSARFSSSRHPEQTSK
jgi:hypothetical protein